jgi:hypothetical protein
MDLFLSSDERVGPLERANLNRIEIPCPFLKPLLLIILTYSLSLSSYQKEERTKPANLLTK